ncbi:MAG: PAS domain-containing protein [candidate division Zixibacteria bacterium]|nr:PAS domain-containing protein [candidate division Zixibacteria bacterium]
MENENRETDSALRRCAVCKIDLKGRLVYIDDRIEKLLGYSREKLFGKLILEFLDEPSQEIVEYLISKRNNFETFYDYTHIGFVSRDGNNIPATAVVSLNFIAGNPSNYIIITTPDNHITHQTPIKENSAYNRLLKSILEMDNRFDIKSFLRQLKSLSEARLAGLYLISNDSLELRHAAGDEDDAFVSISIPETEALHNLVVETGLVYDFTNSETCDALGVTADYAPKEYIARIEFGARGQYLIRLIYDDTISKVDAADGISRCALAIQLATRLAEPLSTSQQNTQQDEKNQTEELNVRFTVGLLDSLGIGALLTDKDGDIVGHNPTIHQMVEQKDIIGDFGRFASLLDNKFSGSFVLDSFLNASDSTCNTQLHISLPDKTPASLIVIRLGDGLKDLTSLVTVIPHEEVTDNQTLIEKQTAGPN